MKNKAIFAIAAIVAAIPGASFAQETPSSTATSPSQDMQSTAPTSPSQDAQSTAPAQPATQSAAPKAGDMVYDNAGATIGSVESVSGQAVVLKTGAGKATIPANSLAMGANGLMINMSKAQVESAITAAHSKRAAN